MTSDERNLINGLFDRLRNVNPGQKDQEADQLIQQSTASQPDSAYKLVQTLLVQEHALNNAQVRIQQLEKQVVDAAHGSGQGSSSGGGFLSGLFGHKADPGPAQQQSAPPNIPAQRLPQASAPQQAYAQNPPPYPSTVNMPASSGGGFLKSALGTAAGVAGGAALFQGIQSLLGHNSGPFGGGGGIFGGGHGGFGGGYGGPEIIENHEVVNNYYDERGNDNDRSNDGGSFLGGVSDPQNSGGYDRDPNDAAHDTPPTDYPNEDADPYSTPPTDDQTDAMDNNYDGDNSDAGGSDYSSNDDSSLV